MVNLDGESCLHVQELQQQRKSRESSGEPSQHLLRVQFQQLLDGLPFERAVCYQAGVFVTVA
jgi:hypothetical protein